MRWPKRDFLKNGGTRHKECGRSLQVEKERAETILRERVARERSSKPMEEEINPFMVSN